MSARYTFRLQSPSRRHPLPHKLLLHQELPETVTPILLKLFAYLLFHRPGLQLEPSLHNDNIPYRPDLVELDYELRPILWIECDPCAVEHLDRLAVKVPEAAIWVMLPSPEEAERLQTAMIKARLRRERYHLLGLETAMMEEINGLLQDRNQVYWVRSSFDPPAMEFDFNGLWFDTTFTLLHV